jgi:hypothetical protein
MSSANAAVAQTAPKIIELFVLSCNINGCPNGSNPSGPLIQASDSDFYGTAFNTNPLGFRQGGTIFRVTAAGQPTTLFTFAADQNGKFSDGVGTTTVSFNGVSTTFRVLNADYIRANEPLGAASIHCRDQCTRYDQECERIPGSVST